MISSQQITFIAKLLSLASYDDLFMLSEIIPEEKARFLRNGLDTKESLKDTSGYRLVELVNVYFRSGIANKNLLEQSKKIKPKITTLEEVPPNSYITRSNYSPNNGMLKFSGEEIVIIGQKNRKTKHDEPLSGKIMRKLFYSQRNFDQGVEARVVLNIRQADYKEQKQNYDKKIRNAVFYLNKKVSEKTGVNSLVIYRNSKLYLNEKYLAKY